MKKLTEHLEKLGAEDYFGEMKLSVKELFGASELDSNPYRDHNWELRRGGGFTVVNAIPDESEQDRLFWEEWYVHGGEVHHHVLTLWKPMSFDEIFVCPPQDDIHPALSFGKRWYVVEDPDMTPLLLRRE